MHEYTCVNYFNHLLLPIVIYVHPVSYIQLATSSTFSCTCIQSATLLPQLPPIIKCCIYYISPQLQLQLYMH